MPECSAGLGPRFKESLLYMHSPDTRSKADNRRGGNFTKTAVLYIVVGHAEHGASIRVSLCLQGAATAKLRDHPGLGAPESRPYICVYIYTHIYIYMVVRCAFSPPPLPPPPSPPQWYLPPNPPKYNTRALRTPTRGPHGGGRGCRRKQSTKPRRWGKGMPQKQRDILFHRAKPQEGYPVPQGGGSGENTP